MRSARINIKDFSATNLPCIGLQKFGSERLEKSGASGKHTNVSGEGYCDDYTKGNRRKIEEGTGGRRVGVDVDAADTEKPGLERRNTAGTGASNGRITEYSYGDGWSDKEGSWSEPWFEVATRFCRMDARIPNRVDRLKSLGNSIVPQIAQVIFEAIKHTERKEVMPMI
jgi:hypothetical protein